MSLTYELTSIGLDIELYDSRILHESRIHRFSYAYSYPIEEAGAILIIRTFIAFEKPRTLAQVKQLRLGLPINPGILFSQWHAEQDPNNPLYGSDDFCV